MRFVVSRSSQGPMSKDPPCIEAIRGPEAPAWPGEFLWYVELDSLDAVMKFVEEHGGAIGVFTAEEGEDYPEIEIFDDTDEEED
jgi:hypothetical protein